MPTNAIPNVGGVLSGGVKNDQMLLEVINNSGGTLQDGDVVIVDVTGALATTTTTANIKSVLGVVSVNGSVNAAGVAQTVAAGAPFTCCIAGVARVQIGANVVAALDILTTFTTVKQAQTNNAATVGMGIAIALEASAAKDTNNTIRALIGKM